MDEQLQAELNALKLRVGRIEDTLQTMIGWQMREYGEEGVQQLLDILVNGIKRETG